MKKLILLWITMMLITVVSYAQTTAVNFTLNDCNGNSHSLFPVIDSGNVVVLVYEHQCSSCQVGVTRLTKAINDSFSKATNIRVMYLDNGGYSCASVKTWITSHNFIQGPAFTYSNDQTSPYGSGMPVIVVTGSKSHKVYIIANSVNIPTVLNLKNAIKSAQSDITTRINTDHIPTGSFYIYPNPVINDKVWIKLNNPGNQPISYEISNSAGQIIVPSKRIKASHEQEEIPLSGLENGVYFIYLNTTEGRIVRKLMISK